MDIETSSPLSYGQTVCDVWCVFVAALTAVSAVTIKFKYDNTYEQCIHIEQLISNCSVALSQ